MKFTLAILVGVGMAALLAVGLVLAVRGHGWLLGLTLAAFLFGFIKVGCLGH